MISEYVLDESSAPSYTTTAVSNNATGAKTRVRLTKAQVNAATADFIEKEGHCQRYELARN
ncbi:hypothetical protein GN244_ATG15766 [Phytophthora infestans]|uniref:Uncharacterized protein n=1 Tax=Phytophthora infestans TaxID=4787 RepID=A0A833SQL9_PHYIN|nr:hypothetical protein GN244_ATG18727 [Phytophthora infestans]KAF4032362.1 hypothetical protein GN244_ATG15766 [Phytophthora infestans]KAF4148539.1 hypothetical protein GN958_ATG02263 [Phytophthora infestans]